MQRTFLTAALAAVIIFISVPALAAGGAYEKGFGFTAGTISGIGFAKRTYQTEMKGNQFGFVAWLADNSGWLNFGYQKINFINRQKSVGLYWLFGTALWLQTENSYYPIDSSGLTLQKMQTYSVTLMPGAGLGIELALEKHLKLNIELPLSVFIEYDKGYDYQRYTKTDGVNISIYPIPQVSLIYFY